MEMTRPLPNLLWIAGLLVQFEYDGVVRQCRKCFLPGHHALTARLPSASVVVCLVTPHAKKNANAARGDHATLDCKSRSYSSVARTASSPSQEGSSAADDRVAPLTDAEGLPLPEKEPEVAPGGTKEGVASKLVETLPPPVVEPLPAAPAAAPVATAADEPAAPPAQAPAAQDGDHSKEESMDLDWKVVRGRKRRARSREPSEERPAVASNDGPGGLDEGLPQLKRAAAADSDEESTSSTVKDSTGG
ncbi:hypothetical protein MTO96_022404 [Rhipicephalus appendiculatus]